jgi:hypothetical protein
MRRRLLAMAAATTILLGAAGTALAVSDGNYDYHEQGCTGNANNSDSASTTEPGCHTMAGNVYAGGVRLFGAGVQQQPDGENPGPEDLSGTGPDQSASPDPNQGARLYFGADDNLDNGEHDSSEQADNGASDGGGIQVNVRPEAVATWMAALAAGDQAYLLTHPVPLADAGLGACADGLCFSAQTQRRVVYEGTNKRKERDAADYEGKKWDPETCSGPDDTAADCGGHPLRWWEKTDGTVYAEPGAQVYEDPDPQGSPIGPYPLTAAYVGTCGVILGGGPGAPPAPASPVTNGAGQLDVATGC